VNAAPVEAATRAAVGDEHNSARAAFAIASWIDANIQPGDFVGPIRSASSVLRTGKGVCRDYAALYVAMARRAGIPSRVVIGLVSARDGFYLHSWAESYVGRWVPVDPTRPHEAFDATHITLGSGSLAEVWDTSRYTGTLTVQIEDYRD
jgi:transglutaminase-like putative cysteine protease